VENSVSILSTQLPKLRKQYEELSAQFQGHTPTTSTTTPNDSSLSSTFTAAKQTPTRSKSVRFDAPYRDASPDDTTSRNALFNSTSTSTSAAQPYTDNDETTPDQSHLSNEQIHMYHKQVLSDQDAQLDALSSSIGRQRLLGIQMGDEMDDQNALLEDVERGTDRFQGRLDAARGRLGKVARKAKDNWSWVTIGVLILILVLLLVILN
jgi:syntaxin 8